MNIRTATFNNLEQISEVEAQCFPAAEAATKEEFADRLHYYGDHFWLMFDHEKLIALLQMNRIYMMKCMKKPLCITLRVPGR